MAESGPIAAVAHVHTLCDEKVLVITAQGQALMLKVDDIAARSRSAGGVRVIELAPGDKVVSVTV
jgi:DNA gyrase subunit A